MPPRSLLGFFALLSSLAIPAPAFASRNAGSIEGVVTTPDGRPAAAATVSWELACFGDQTVTDAEGRYRFDDVPYLTVLLQATSRDMASSLGRLEVALPGLGRTRRLDLRLQRRDAANLKLSVDADGYAVNFEPIGDATARPTEGLSAATETRSLALTIPPGRYRLTIRGQAGRRWLQRELTVTAGLRTLSLRLEAGEAVSARLRGPDGRPVAAEVALKPQSPLPTPTGKERFLRTRAGPDGRFRSGPLPRGPYELIVRPLDPRLAFASRALSAGRPATIALVSWVPLRVRRATPWTDGAITLAGPHGLDARLCADPRVLEVTGLAPGVAAELRVACRRGEEVVGCVLPLRGGRDEGLTLRRLEPLRGRCSTAGVPWPEESELFFWRAPSRFEREVNVSLFGLKLDDDKPTETLDDYLRKLSEDQALVVHPDAIGRTSERGRYEVRLLPGSWLVGTSLTHRRPLEAPKGPWNGPLDFAD